MKKCLATHRECCPSRLHGADVFVPTRLLDVGNDSIRLIESEHEIDEGADRSFVALSHCWGLVPIIRTLRENYDAHRKSINTEQLSKTFREAIHTTRKLGYRYIWIDSLCIIQDDEEDWNKEAATMCDVYQCAVLTIAATHAPGGDTGCFAPRDGLLQLPFYIEVPHVTATDAHIRIVFASYGRTSVVGGGDAVLFRRSWVLQEQLLSHRILMFDGTSLKWECLSMHGSETSPTSGTTRYTNYHKAVRTGIMDDHEYFDPPKGAKTLPQDHVFWAQMQVQYWCEMVMEYTHRGMTKPEDRLVALSGIAKALNRHTNKEYWAGLWSQYFTTGLLWGISHGSGIFLTSYNASDTGQNEKSRHKDAIAPSWSWASVTTAVLYGQGELLNFDRICDVVNVSVSGSVKIQTGSATIRGHVRRGYLNPVYPHAIQEAVAELPHMTAPPPTKRRRLEYSNFKDRLFDPDRYFLISEKHPAPSLKDTSPLNTSKNGNFRLMRGCFQPDELIDPCTEITFIAIAQRHFGSQLTSLLHTHDDEAALRVHTLALVPTEGKPGEYRRVGLAIWEQCAWYGYLCGWKDERDRRVYRPANYLDNGYFQDDSWWDWLARKIWWDDLEALNECKKGKHKHAYKADTLPELGMYHPNIKVSEETVVII
jgi:hypothetical protein